MSGPVYDRQPSVIVQSELAGEPKFQSGEAVLLFLTTGTWYDPSRPSAYVLPPGHLRLVDNEKWHVEQGSVWSTHVPEKKHAIAWMDEEIMAAVHAQSTGCEKADRE
jgi:hypothetical protein